MTDPPLTVAELAARSDPDLLDPFERAVAFAIREALRLRRERVKGRRRIAAVDGQTR